MRRPLAILGLLVALVAGGCSGDGDGGEVADPISVDTTSGLARTVSGAVDLRPLVVSRAPLGYMQLPNPPFGPVDLDRLLESFSDAPTEDRVILTEAGFQRGYTRGWRMENPRSFLGIFVFEFDDEEGARTARDQFAAQNVTKKDATRFAVDTIEDAIGESYTRVLDDGPSERTHVVTFVRGTRLYQVGGQFEVVDTPVDETVALALVEDQIAA